MGTENEHALSCNYNFLITELSELKLFIYYTIKGI